MVDNDCVTDLEETHAIPNNNVQCKEKVREVESPSIEIDIPPSNYDIKTFAKEEVKEQVKFYKWIKNFNLVKIILIIMCIMYIIDILCTGGQSSLKDPFFEVLKTMLLMVSGYIFAKNQNE